MVAILLIADKNTNIKLCDEGKNQNSCIIRNYK